MGNVVKLHERQETRLKGLTDVKACLLDQIDSTADFRAMKAVQYPDDDRNRRSAKALTKLHAHVEGLPVNHDLFRAMHRAVLSGNDLTTIIEEENYRLGRYGFHYGDENPEEFIADWARLYQDANAGEVD